MKTVDLESIRAKHAAELAKAAAENEIITAFDSAPVSPDSLFMHSLYGHEGTLRFGDSFKGSYLTPLQIADLAEKFPPLPMLKRKDGCTSFPLETWFDSLPDDHREKRGEVASIAPFLLKADFACVPQHHHAAKVSIEWTATVAGRAMTFECLLSPHAVLAVQFDKENRRNEYARVKDTRVTFRPGWAAWSGDSVPVLHHVTGGDNCERMDVIKWGRGSDEAGHNFTWYSGCNDADLAHHLRRVAELTA